MDASKILHAIIGPLPPNGLYHANTIQNLSMVIYYETKLSTINIQISCAQGFSSFLYFMVAIHIFLILIHLLHIMPCYDTFVAF